MNTLFRCLTLVFSFGLAASSTNAEVLVTERESVYGRDRVQFEIDFPRTSLGNVESEEWPSIEMKVTKLAKKKSFKIPCRMSGGTKRSGRSTKSYQAVSCYQTNGGWEDDSRYPNPDTFEKMEIEIRRKWKSGQGVSYDLFAVYEGEGAELGFEADLLFAEREDFNVADVQLVPDFGKRSRGTDPFDLMIRLDRALQSSVGTHYYSLEEDKNVTITGFQYQIDGLFMVDLTALVGPGGETPADDLGRIDLLETRNRPLKRKFVPQSVLEEEIRLLLANFSREDQ